MITEKEANKLRFIEDDIPNGIISLANDGDAKIALDDDAINLWATEIQYLNPDDDHTYYIAAPDEVTINTDFAVNADNKRIFYVYGSNSIYMDLPTQDPHQKNKLWNDNGIVKISLG